MGPLMGVHLKARAAASDLSEQVSGWRRLWPSALTALAIALRGGALLRARRTTRWRAPGGACKALSPDPVPGFLQNGEAPDFQLPDASGRMVSLSAQRGHPVLLNFWATWCPPCVEEVPSMEDLARKLDGTDMRMLAVSVDDDWDAIRQFFVKGTKIGVLLDTSHDVPKSFGTEKYPESFLIDAAGRVRYYFINKRDWSRPEAVACLESLR